jgi:hypothetical protein
MAANPNSFNYWVADGTVLPPYLLSKVAGIADENYWVADGTVAFPAAIQKVASASANLGFFTLMGM